MPEPVPVAPCAFWANADAISIAPTTSAESASLPTTTYASNFPVEDKIVPALWRFARSAAATAPPIVAPNIAAPTDKATIFFNTFFAFMANPFIFNSPTSLGG